MTRAARNLPNGPDRIHTDAMLDGWHRRGPNECDSLYRSPVRIIVEYFHPESGIEATLYQDGRIECWGAVPVEVVTQLIGDWHLSLRGQIA